MTFTVQDAAAADQPAIEHLLDLSFGIDRRTKTSYRLREGSHAVDGLSLVIGDEGVGIAGAISFWPLAIGESGTPALLLGPLAVHPQRQNLGVGLALMREGLARATSRGHRLVLLVGDEPYYGRVGFKKVPGGVMLMPGPTNPDRFLYLELQPGAVQGVHGMVLPHYRFAEKSAAFAVPHGTGKQQQHAEA